MQLRHIPWYLKIEDCSLPIYHAMELFFARQCNFPFINKILGIFHSKKHVKRYCISRPALIMSLRSRKTEKNIVVGKKFGWTGPRAVIYRPGGFLREWRPRQKRRLARMKKSGASPSVILDRTILMWLSFYRGRRRPGDIKKESFFQPQPFFLAAKAAKRSLQIHTHLNIWIFCSCKYRIPTK